MLTKIILGGSDTKQKQSQHGTAIDQQQSLRLCLKILTSLIQSNVLFPSKHTVLEATK